MINFIIEEIYIKIKWKIPSKNVYFWHWIGYFLSGGPMVVPNRIIKIEVYLRAFSFRVGVNLETIF